MSKGAPSTLGVRLQVGAHRRLRIVEALYADRVTRNLALEQRAAAALLKENPGLAVVVHRVGSQQRCRALHQVCTQVSHDKKPLYGAGMPTMATLYYA